MQHFRSSLTRLKGLVEQKLPEGADIYGYQGICRESLVVALDTAYNLSQEIKNDDESRFEVVSLKRAGSALYKTLKDFLDSDAADSDKQIRFNDFLDALSALVEKTKMTYYIVGKHGVRNDEELALLRTSIAEMTVLSDEFKEEKGKVESEAESISAAIAAITTSHKATAQMASEIKHWHTDAVTQHAAIEKTHEAIAGWDDEIEEHSAQYEAQSKQIAELTLAATQSRDKLSADAAVGQKQVEDLKHNAEQHRKLLDEIKGTLEGANRVGMAASFQARKNELGRQQTTWQVVFVGSVVLITLAVWKFVLPTVTNIAADSHGWTKLLAELGIVFPLVWLGWFAAKQFGYTSKIREDYAFKAASAMAYEGHKKAARDVNEDLERILLEFSLYNMAQNPLRLYGSGDIYGTPLHEALDQLLRKFPKLRRISGEVPSLGRLEVEGEKNACAEDKE